SESRDALERAPFEELHHEVVAGGGLRGLLRPPDVVVGGGGGGGGLPGGQHTHGRAVGGIRALRLLVGAARCGVAAGARARGRPALSGPSARTRTAPRGCASAFAR